MAENNVRVRQSRDDYLRPPSTENEEEQENYVTRQYNVPATSVGPPNWLDVFTLENYQKRALEEQAAREAAAAAASPQSPTEFVQGPPIPGPIVPGDPRWSYERMMAERGTPVNPQGQTFSQMIAGYQFDNTPYDQAAQYLADRRLAQMEAVQNMYNQYAAETQANVDRIGDIYTGAETGIGQTYDSATGNIEDAYASAQQQAADQMARLGIEEAAPAVVNPMALSQAETMSGLEANRASGLGATQQFGATAGGYASNMATVAQQQALEGQRSLTDQLSDQLFELEMQRLQAQQAYNPYQRALQELEAQQAFNQFYNPPADPMERELALDLARQQVENQMQYDVNLTRSVQEFMSQGYSYDEALQLAANLLTYNPYQQ